MATDPDSKPVLGGRRAGDAQVVYSVRELLDQIRIAQAEGFARMDAVLSDKADKGDVVRIQSDIGKLDLRVTKVERRVDDDELKTHAQKAEHDRTWSLGKKIFAGAVTLAGLGMTVIGPYIGTHV